jgi:integrase
MLTEKQLLNLKPRSSLYRMADGGGLCIEVPATGSPRWRYRYRFNRAARMLSLGTYPEVKAAQARKLAAAAKDLLQKGIDPSAQRQTDKITRHLSAATTFNAVGEEWLAGRNDLATVTLKKHRWMLNDLAGPWIGGRPVGEITPPEMLAVLRRVESQGHLETAQRLKALCSQVFRYAVATGRAERDPAADLRGALKTAKTRHHASITDPVKVGELLRAIDGYGGTLGVLSALKLAPLVFVRPGELRKAQWSEFDLDDAMWVIPAERMKMAEKHFVPLSEQAVAVLRELQPLTGNHALVFPGARRVTSPMSDGTVNAALRRLGFDKDAMTGHGFRSMASTLLHEQGYQPDWIERQLAHAERNKVRAAYNYAQHMTERRKMMQAWADYLDGLRAGGKVFAIRRKGG